MHWRLDWLEHLEDRVRWSNRNPDPFLAMCLVFAFWTGELEVLQVNNSQEFNSLIYSLLYSSGLGQDLTRIISLLP